MEIDSLSRALAMPLDYWDSLTSRSPLPDRWRKIVERFILNSREPLNPVANEEEEWDIWNFYESFQKEQTQNERILLVLIDEGICLHSALFNLAQHYKLNGDAQTALHYLDRLFSAFGESDDELYARAQVQFALKHYVECGRVLRRLKQKYPEFSGPYLFQLRLDFVTCRPKTVMAKRWHHLNQLDPKIKNFVPDWYFAIAHIIDPENYLLRKEARPEFAGLFELRREFSQKRSLQRHK